MIRAAHWNISTDGRNTDEVGQEVEVDNQPTPTGKGRCDYVLWGKDGSPLAVIEAKKTSENADNTYLRIASQEQQGAYRF